MLAFLCLERVRHPPDRGSMGNTRRNGATRLRLLAPRKGGRPKKPWPDLDQNDVTFVALEKNRGTFRLSPGFR
jgi:hypothetical protein